MKDKDIGFDRIAHMFGPLKTEELKWRWNLDNDDFDMDFRAFEKVVGCSLAIHDFNDFYQLLGETEQNKLLAYTESYMRGETPPPIKLSIVNHNNDVLHFTFKAESRYKTRFEGSIRFSMNLPDSSELMRLFYQVFNSEHHGVVITDEETKILTCNQYFEKYSGYSYSELAGRKTNVFNAHKHGKQFFTDMWSHIHYYGYWSGMILSRRKKGNIEPQELTIQKIDSNDKVYYLGITRDLSKSLYRLEGKEYGGIELLTQLPSKKAFQSQLESMSESLTEQQGMIAIVIKLNDVEEKNLNIIQSMSSALSLGTTNQIAGFLGGNIFSSAISYRKEEGVKEYSTIYKVIRALIDKLRTRLTQSEYRILTKSVIGVSVLKEDTDDVKRMLPNALKAMLENHSKTGSAVCFYNSDMHQKFKRRERLEKVIRAAVANRKIDVYYQPIFSTNDWTIAKFETLCRFKDTNGEVLNTQEVIEIAEELNLVNDLDLIVAETALIHRKELAKKHSDSVGISINISLSSQNNVRTVLNKLILLLSKHSENAKYLSIELSDHIDLEDATVSRLINELVNLGVSLCLDDFLSGQSVFSYINDERFKYLKIEREFVREITKESKNYNIVRSITLLAQSMGVKVIAKGVEQLSEIEILHGLGIDYMQGFYFAHPAPLDKVAPYSSYIRTIKKLRTTCSEEKKVSLITQPTTLQPNDNLAYIKEIFDSSTFNVLPVIDNRICVGIIDRAACNLHASPTMGTEIETANDVKALNKRAHQIMIPSARTVSKNIGQDEIISNIENENPPPWVVINDDGRYLGIVEESHVLSYLHQAISC